MSYLAVWGDNGPVIVRWDYGAYALPVTVRVGATMPLLASAVGQVFLAYLPDTLTDPVLKAQNPPASPARQPKSRSNRPRRPSAARAWPSPPAG